jgi:type II secretory pathway pseudopilin PulG
MRQKTPVGFTLIQVLVTAGVIAMLSVIMAAGIINQQRFAQRTERAVSSTFIAEAGINYYLWHLSHNANDYCDGKACETQGEFGYGPFTYDYKTPDGRVAGSYQVYVKPPQGSSATVTIRSVGQAKNSPIRTLQASIAVPSFAQYAILTNTEIWIGSNETVDGPLHSNIGIHFDGIGNDAITASQVSYRPSSQFGGNGQTQNGVWGNGGPNNLWRFPTPPVDFQSVTADLQKMKTDAQANGQYLPPTNPANPNSKLGYYLELRSDGRIDVYRLTREQCSSTNRTFIQTINAPANNILFAEDNIWIRNVPGQAYSGRLTIAAAYMPSSSSTDKSITIMGNILYSAKDGSSSIGLIGQKDVRVSRQAPSTLEIHAALLAQNGSVRYNKDTLGGSSCSQQVKTKLTLYGAIATNQYWTWTYVAGGGGGYTPIDGYATTVNSYDKQLRFSPPPSFPLTGTFSILNYRELLSSP